MKYCPLTDLKKQLDGDLSVLNMEQVTVSHLQVQMLTGVAVVSSGWLLFTVTFLRNMLQVNKVWTFAQNKK